MPYAPINMPLPESGQEIAEQIRNSILGPIIQGSEYQSMLGQQPGLNLGPDMPKLLIGLMRALGLADPSGMTGGPAGLVWGKPSPQWATALSRYRALGLAVENQFPRIGAVTKQTPVNLMDVLSSRPKSLGEYISPSPLRPQGTINLYGPRDISTIWHEMAHDLYTKDPAARALAREMRLAAPVGTEAALAKRGITEARYIEPEYFAYATENLLEEKLGLNILADISAIKAPPEMRGKILEFLKSTPKNKQKETLEAITGIFGKTKAPSTSETLKQLYKDTMNFSAENHPLRSQIEIDPFARVKFANELKTRINILADTSFKKKLNSDLIKIGDPKDPKSTIGLEIIAQDLHENMGRQTAKYETLLKAEFGEEDAKKIIYKNWNNVLNEVEEGPIKLLKSERGSFSTKPIGKQAVKEQKDIIKNKEIMDVIKEAMRGPNRKGGGMIVNKGDRLSTYLEDYPTSGPGWEWTK